jgi:hypothetical protein
MGVSGARRDDREAVVADAVGEAGVVGHNRVDQIVAGKPEAVTRWIASSVATPAGGTVSAAASTASSTGTSATPREELVSGVEDSLPQAEPAQLDPQRRLETWMSKRSSPRRIAPASGSSSSTRPSALVST